MIDIVPSIIQASFVSGVCDTRASLCQVFGSWLEIYLLRNIAVLLCNIHSSFNCIHFSSGGSHCN